ncbi:uncharacterized protein NFIA_087990 [Aspergillus fischeri NRRL 181]|uniref:Uncharacterized protein n=1 Tax=Neosartorya fischeri (strain ATCC 1020 / DSM 3700 / CBS 544.65 / FGSC A1164 / JCM 1740 / NRRL 181 / WB 181) TaxID=331117 RepID=A1DHI6_NEOFI|nr:uncharacterized protein NFIA_087990 [Aspergillus fischeri NRRL 181]EAW18843.1 hypothetical protein NFIA_087990 [Aspergillus fischeri NRRL 181]
MFLQRGGLLAVMNGDPVRAWPLESVDQPAAHTPSKKNDVVEKATTPDVFVSSPSEGLLTRSQKKQSLSVRIQKIIAKQTHPTRSISLINFEDLPEELKAYEPGHYRRKRTISPLEVSCGKDPEDIAMKEARVLTAEDVIFSGLMTISKLRSNESKEEEVLPPVNRCLWTVVRKTRRARQTRLAEMFQCSWTEDEKLHFHHANYQDINEEKDKK